jgi:hypothetical protein
MIKHIFSPLQKPGSYFTDSTPIDFTSRQCERRDLNGMVLTSPKNLFICWLSYLVNVVGITDHEYFETMHLCGVILVFFSPKGCWTSNR